MAIEVRQRPIGHSTDDTDSPAASSAAVAVDRSVAVAESCRRVLYLWRCYTSSCSGVYKSEVAEDMLIGISRLICLRLQSINR